MVGAPLITFALRQAPTLSQALMLMGTVMLVWMVELLNSALEALSDAVTVEKHPLIGRAKDMSSARSCSAWCSPSLPGRLSSGRS